MEIEGITRIATVDTIVVNKEKYVTDTSAWQRCPIIRIDEYAQDAPMTPMRAIIIARIWWYSSAELGLSAPVSPESGESPVEDAEKGRAIRTTPTSDTTPASCCLRVKVSLGMKREQA
jgi:hypothetical protein